MPDPTDNPSSDGTAATKCPVGAVVWLVEVGCYEDRYVAGVYATVEDAIAAHPLPEGYRFPEKPSASDLSQPTGWHQVEEGRWSNGMDWSYAASAEAITVEGATDE